MQWESTKWPAGLSTYNVTFRAQTSSLASFAWGHLGWLVGIKSSHQVTSETKSDKPMSEMKTGHGACDEPHIFEHICPAKHLCGATCFVLNQSANLRNLSFAESMLCAGCKIWLRGPFSSSFFLGLQYQDSFFCLRSFKIRTIKPWTLLPKIGS